MSKKFSFVKIIFVSVIALTIFPILVIVTSLGYVFATAPTVSFTEGTTANGTQYTTSDPNYLTINAGLTTSGVGDRYSFVNFDESLMVWLRAEQNANDDSNQGNNGTIYNVGYDVNGAFGYSFSGFDNSSANYVLIDYQQNEVPISISLWANRNNGVISEASMIIGNDNGGFDFYIGVQEDGLYRVGTGDSDLANASTSVIGQWEHLVYIVENDSTKLYKNTELVASVNHGVSANGTNFKLGVRSGDNALPFYGKIDEVLIFNRVLGEDEILSLYNANVNDYSHVFGDATSLGDGDLGYDSYTLKGYSVNKSAEKGETELRTVTFVNGGSPIVTNISATSTTQTEVTFNADIDGNSLDVSVHGFNYGETLSYGSTTSESGTFSGTYQLSDDITGLSCGTEYHYRAYATNPAGTTNGDDATFETSPCDSPTLTTGSASGITESTALVSGEITDTGGDNVSDRGFQYGLTASYGSVASTTGSFDAGTYSNDLTDLVCSTVYHYRFFATNSGGTSYGSDSTFTTADCADQGGRKSAPRRTSDQISSTFQGPVFIPVNSIIGQTGAVISGPSSLIENLDLSPAPEDTEEVIKIKEAILNIFSNILKFLAEQIKIMLSI